MYYESAQIYAVLDKVKTKTLQPVPKIQPV